MCKMTLLYIITFSVMLSVARSLHYLTSESNAKSFQSGIDVLEDIVGLSFFTSCVLGICTRCRCMRLSFVLHLLHVSFFDCVNWHDQFYVFKISDVETCYLFRGLVATISSSPASRLVSSCCYICSDRPGLCKDIIRTPPPPSRTPSYLTYLTYKSLQSRVTLSVPCRWS